MTLERERKAWLLKKREVGTYSVRTNERVTKVTEGRDEEQFGRGRRARRKDKVNEKKSEKNRRTIWEVKRKRTMRGCGMKSETKKRKERRGEGRTDITIGRKCKRAIKGEDKERRRI